MLFFEWLASNNLTSSWKFVRIGCSFTDYRYRIKRDEILDYATALLGKDNHVSLVMDLILSIDDTFETNRIIELLSRSESSDEEIEKRKWNVYVISNAVEDLSSVPTVKELLSLGDLWGYLGYPRHYPWDVRENEYIKCEDVEYMIQTHKEWIINEIAELQHA